MRFDGTFKTFRVRKLVHDKEIIWDCIDSFLDVEELPQKSEWTGTTIIWTIETAPEGAVLRVVHAGLSPEVGCYQACEAGWLHFVGQSLKPFIETGLGKPYGAQF